MKLHILSLTLCLIMILSFITGCATLDQKINLKYKPVDRPYGINSGEVFVSRIDPSPLLQNGKGEWIVGSLNNVYGVKQADILSDRTLGEWISDALVQELKQAGYRAAYSAKLPSGAARGVLINDVNVFMNVNSGIGRAETKQELKFNVDIILNDSKIKTLTIAARDNKTLPLTASLEEKESIMQLSLQDAMQQVIPELIITFNKK